MYTSRGVAVHGCTLTVVQECRPRGVPGVYTTRDPSTSQKKTLFSAFLRFPEKRLPWAPSPTSARPDLNLSSPDLNLSSARSQPQLSQISASARTQRLPDLSVCRFLPVSAVSWLFLPVSSASWLFLPFLPFLLFLPYSAVSAVFCRICRIQCYPEFSVIQRFFS